MASDGRKVDVAVVLKAKAERLYCLFKTSISHRNGRQICAIKILAFNPRRYGHTMQLKDMRLRMRLHALVRSKLTSDAHDITREEAVHFRREPRALRLHREGLQTLT